MNGNSAFVISQAVQLIAAGGRYQHMRLQDVVEELLIEMECLDDYFDPPPEDEKGTIQ